MISHGVSLSSGRPPARRPALTAAARTAGIAGIVLAAATATAVAAAQTGRVAARSAAWAIQPTPNPLLRDGGLNAGDFTAVSCNSAGACTAVVSSFYRTVTEAWNGTSWSLEYPPGPGGSHRILSDVSCVPAGGCTAVGHYDGPAEELTLAAAKP
jgi:hypothetical protein